MTKIHWWWIIAFLIGVALALAGYPIYDGCVHVKNFMLMVVIFVIAAILFWKSNEF